jgi:DNA-binding NarL/FixJ family response regulator
VLKDAPAADLIRAVRTVASGAAWLDPKVTPRVLAIYRTTVLPQARQQRRAAQLTSREHDVLRLMANGATNPEIAGALHVSGGTVKAHIGSIFTKLDARDRAAAIVYAYQHGIASPPGPA